MANSTVAIEKVIKEEGGYQAGTADSGNYRNGKLLGTKYGITPNAYFAFYKQEPTRDTIKNLTIAQATPIYKTNYWDKIGGDGIANVSVADLMMFMVVNSGLSQIKSIKHIANETAGKKIFAETTTPFTATEIQLLNALPQQTFFSNLKTYRERFYYALVQHKPSNKIYLTGWLSRLDKHVFKSEGSINPKDDAGGNLMFVGVLAVIGLFLLIK